MKKLLAILLLLCMAGSCTAFADSTKLVPVHKQSMDNYGAEDCTMSVNFETATAIDDNLNITYTAYQVDYYPTEQVEALKAGDTVLVYEQEFMVESVEKTEDQINVNGESGLYFSPSIDEEGMMTCDDGTETPSSTNMGTYTFPLADQVKLLTYRMDEDGTVQEGMDEQVLTPAEVKTFFAEHGDSSKDNYVSGWGSAVKLRVAEGKVQEIIMDWSSDS